MKADQEHWYESKDAGFDDCDMYDYSDDCEEMIHSDPDDAIESALDVHLERQGDVLEQLRTSVGETITVYGFTHRKLDHTTEWCIDPQGILEHILQALDEKYGGDEPTEPTARMKAVAEELSRVMREEYEVWQCHQTHKAEVNVEAWIRARNPEWLDPVRV